MPKFLALHGFLGTPEDFDFLKAKFNIVAPDLSKLVELDKQELYKYLINIINIESIDYIIGYSFGSRLGLSLKVENQLDLPIYCLAGHMGLNPKELGVRGEVEEKFCEKIISLNRQEFLKYWNSLELFKYDEPLKKINFNNAQLFFEKYGLAKQLELIPRVKERSDFHFLYGDKDTKYKTYALKNLKKFDVELLQDAGHRLIQYPECVMNWLQRKLNE